MSGNGHIPVLLRDVLEFLDVQRNGVYVDCTVGLGGHSLEILHTNPNAKVIVADPNKNTQKLKSVSELDEETREIVRNALISTMSINVSAVKPSKYVHAKKA